MGVSMLNSRPISSSSRLRFCILGGSIDSGCEKIREGMGKVMGEGSLNKQEKFKISQGQGQSSHGRDIISRRRKNYSTNVFL